LANALLLPPQFSPGQKILSHPGAHRPRTFRAAQPAEIHSLRASQSVKPERDLKSLLAFAGDDAEEIDFSSIGELYALIESGFRNINAKELFIGSPTQQMTKDLVHFPDLVPVVDRASAIRAIHEITEQGEGNNRDRDDSHFGAFVAILRELLDTKAQGSSFSPSRPVMHNPSAALERGYGLIPTQSTTFSRRASPPFSIPCTASC